MFKVKKDSWSTHLWWLCLASFNITWKHVANSKLCAKLFSRNGWILFLNLFRKLACFYFVEVVKLHLFVKYVMLNENTIWLHYMICLKIEESCKKNQNTFGNYMCRILANVAMKSVSKCVVTNNVERFPRYFKVVEKF